MTDREYDEEFNLTDFEYVMSALAYAAYEGLTLKEFLATVELSDNGEEFDAGIVALIKLKDIVNGTEPF